MFNMFFRKKIDPMDVESMDNQGDFSLKTLLGPEFGMNDLELLETIGTGTFGRVRLARSIVGNKYYALKIMKKNRIVRLKQLAHIQNEVKILSRLRCLFAQNFEGMFQDDTNIYLILEYYPGGELFSHLRRKKKFDEDVAKFFACEVIAALEYMHKLYIAHRDIRPENLLLGADGHVCIVDFGFAKIVPEQTYTLCGTPEYIAPEIISGSGHGRAVDYWALGILTYEMLFGHPPFFGENPFNVYQLILKCKLKFSMITSISLNAKNLLKGLIVVDRGTRMGAGSGGVRKLKSQPFFKGIAWDSVEKKLIVPPFVPMVKSDGDTSNFDYYPEEMTEEICNLTQTERTMFEEFDRILDRPIKL